MRYEIDIVTTKVRVAELAELDRLDKPEVAGPWIVRLLAGAELDPSLEQFGFIALDSRHHLLGWRNLHTGTTDQCPADPRTVFRHALAMDAAGIVLYHTHPSGDLDPSRDDLELTRRLAEGGRVLSLPVLDHIIAAPSRRWLSLRTVRPEIFSDRPRM